MRKLLVLSALACLGVSAYAADGATLYKKCAVCHGAKADKVYLNKVPALNSLTPAERLQYMKEYAAGTRNAYGQGAIMKINLKGLTEADFQAIENYIESLKK
ncbi:c-type cytochrome [Campylobacter peloridis]|uniref:c-type cytochrome n=1 Tax=Campylobacter peloridis TaxID=488546 RepID=UPI001C72E24B|nr:c-type cytochrome [Campylobacter peloridis]MBX1886050.1 c-type cytochrome [Campylobacter peloridis]